MSAARREAILVVATVSFQPEGGAKARLLLAIEFDGAAYPEASNVLRMFSQPATTQSS
jgi:hypothetical protein